MNVNSLLGLTSTASTTANTTASQTAATDTTPLGQALRKAGTRVQSQITTTSAQISAFGKLKAAVSDAQLGARNLAQLPEGGSAQNVKTAAQRFVASFNTAVSAGLATDAASASADAGAKKVGSLGRTLLPYTAATDTLRRMGIKQRPDGRLSMDATKFDAAQKADPGAVQKALAGLGQAVEKSAANELSSTSKVGAALTSLNLRSKTLLSQQNALRAIPQPATTTTTTAATPATSSATTGDWRQALAAYAAYR